MPPRFWGMPDRWTLHVGRIEAYCEQWNVGSHQFLDAPVDGTQRREWAIAVRSIRRLRRLEASRLARSVGRGVGIER